MAFIDITDLDISIDSDSQHERTVTLDGYTYVTYSNNKTLVFKGDAKEPRYEITHLGCTCPGDRYSSNMCKHRKALMYLCDGSAVPPVEGTTVKVKQHEESRISNSIVDLSEEEIDSLFG